jgi:hypothetical protein
MCRMMKPQTNSSRKSWGDLNRCFSSDVVAQPGHEGAAPLVDGGQGQAGDGQDQDHQVKSQVGAGSQGMMAEALRFGETIAGCAHGGDPGPPLPQGGQAGMRGAVDAPGDAAHQAQDQA